MGTAIDKLRNRIELARVWIPPFDRVKNGNVEHVDGYWREVPTGSPTIVTPATHEPKLTKTDAGYDVAARDWWEPTLPTGEGNMKFGSMESLDYFTKTDTEPGTGIRSLVTPDGREVGPSTPYVTGYDKKYLGALQVWAEDHGMTQKELLTTMTKTAQDWYDSHYPSITVPAAVLPELFAKGGHFKNQFESKKSNGMYKPGTRKDIETELFGYPMLKVKAKDRPVYGYVGDAEGDGPSAGVGQYGDVFFIFKDEVRKRTTVTQEDSADRNLVPEPMNDVSWRQDIVNPGSSNANRSDAGDGKHITTYSGREFSEDLPDDITEDKAYDWLYDNLPKQETVDWRTFRPEDATAQYVEAQYHGGISLDDVQKVVFLHKNVADSYRKQFEDRGIKVEIRSLEGERIGGMSFKKDDPRVPKEIRDAYAKRKYQGTNGEFYASFPTLVDERVDDDGVRSWRIHFQIEPTTQDDGTKYGAPLTIPAWDLSGRVREGEDVFALEEQAAEFNDDTKTYGEL